MSLYRLGSRRTNTNYLRLLHTQPHVQATLASQRQRKTAFVLTACTTATASVLAMTTTISPYTLSERGVHAYAPDQPSLDQEVSLMFSSPAEPSTATLASPDAREFVGSLTTAMQDKDEELEEAVGAKAKGNADEATAGADAAITGAKKAKGNRIPSAADVLATYTNVRVFHSVPYTKNSGDWKHRLDIYCPREPSAEPRDVVIHVHGGGWKRGDRSIPFYGSPSVCAGYASHGIIAVAPSYRLGNHPDHLEDVVRCIEWVRENISKVGGNVDRVFLSGHSAGGNIVSLLAIDDTYLSHLPADFIKGVVAMSGVYSLHRPMGGCGAWKNWIFHQQYIRPTFGEEERVIVKNSPSCLLRIGLGDDPHANKHKCFTQRWASLLCQRMGGAPNQTEKTKVSSTRKIPPFLVLNASWDLGLEEDAKTFVELLKKCEVPVVHQFVDDTNHASVCWDTRTHQLVSKYVATKLAQLALN